MSGQPLPHEPAARDAVPRDDGPTNVVDMLRRRAALSPDLGYTFLVDGRHEEQHLSFSALDRRATEVAARLQLRGLPGARALLLFPAGLELLTGFFGCLYAGVLPIVAPLPARSRLARIVPRIRGIARDAAPAIVVTTREALPAARELCGLAELEPRDWLVVDAPDPLVSEPPPWQERSPAASDLAYLQYTSGSTSAPRGTLLTHANLLDNSRATQQAQGSDGSSVSVVWVPAYHDDGLVQGILQPIFTGYRCVLMAPEHVIARPASWLEAITRHRATHSGGPNFVYELCLRKVPDDVRAGLDLSSWRFAYNAAEPIRWQTLAAFYERFGPAGFRWTTFAPCFGLAEATLMVTSKNDRAGATLLPVDGSALAAGRVRLADRSTRDVTTLVGCGMPMGRSRLAFVQPGTHLRAASDAVGELCITGPSVAVGYYGRPEETAQTFGLALADEPGTHYLRTGDLGFVHAGELFITGRHKDLIIIRGENRYPQDIEWSVETCHEAIRPGGIAAFSIAGDEGEQLVIVAEAQLPGRVAGPDPEADARAAAPVIAAIRRTVAHAHELTVAAVTLVVPGTIPKTSSGKLQRAACRQAFLDGTLAALVRWTAASEPAAPGEPLAPGPAAGPDAPSHAERVRTIELWLLDHLARQLGVPITELRPRDPFASYGLDSVAGVTLAAALGEWLGLSLPPVVAWDHPSITALAEHVATRLEGAPASTPSAAPSRAPSDDPIAIVGIGCRFPGDASSPQALWERLRAGTDAIGPAPAERLGGPGREPWLRGGYLQGVEGFEPEHFEMSPREAQTLDPQQRLLLEVGWEALEDAGLPPGSLRDAEVGVFVGICSDDHRRRLDEHHVQGFHAVTGNVHAVAAGRLSYLLGLTGPCLAVDTACSSSLVAVHLACRSLRAGECEVALASGVSVILHRPTTEVFAGAGMLSPDGRCRAFDAEANGYVRGEGCGVVVLEPLSRARAHGHVVHAVIRGSMVNQDGRSSGLTAPRGPSQEQLVRRALREAGLEPGDVGYVEAHGTGTPLGDPIELGALAGVFGRRPDPARPLWVGSIKSAIGHLEGAAGIAGLVKAVLCVRHGEIPAQVDFRTPTPHFAWEASSLRVPTTLVRWADARRIAGVSSFGLGGTNAHVIVEQAPAPASAPAPAPAWHVLALSARTDEALDALAEGYRARLERDRETLRDPAVLAELCRRTNLGRAMLERRRVVVGASAEALAQALAAPPESRSPRPRADGRAGLAFMLSGQGSQHPGMGLPLHAALPAFREALDRCDAILRPWLGTSLLAVLREPAERSPIHETRFTQPALVAIELALAEQWRAWGVTPDVVVGHSIGEIAAAHVAGVLSLDDALRLAAARGRLMQALPGAGAMLAVAAGDDEVQALVDASAGALVVAVDNGPHRRVLAGPRAAIEAAAAGLAARGVPARLLPVSHAFHSPLVEPMLAELAEVVRSLELRPPRVALVSTVTGTLVRDELTTVEHWVRQARQPVRFAAALAACRPLASTFVEVGPDTVLTSLARQWLAAQGEPPDAVIPGLPLDGPEPEPMLASLGAAFVRGARPDWAAVHGPRHGHGPHVELPTYPFQRRRLWALDDRAPAPARRDRVTRAPLLDAVLVETDLAGPTSLDEAAQAELVAAAARAGLGWAECRVQDLALAEPLVVDARGRTAQVVLTEANGAAARARLVTHVPDDPAAPALVHASGRIVRTGAGARAQWLYATTWREVPRYGLATARFPARERLRAAAPTSEEELAVLTRHAHAQAQLSVICAARVVAMLAEGGVPLRVGDRLALDEVATRLRVRDGQRPLLQRLLTILAEDGVLAGTGRGPWQVLAAPVPPPLRPALAAVRAEHGDVAAAELALLERCADRLLDVLRGDEDPMPLLFPSGDTSTATLLYTESPVAVAMNRAVAAAVAAIVQGTKDGVRVLEIGAGTGGTTRWILPRLASHGVEYTFTDVGPSFVHKARQRFADDTRLRYHVLDVEASPAAQGLPAHAYDIVVAANVLHATRDPAAALAHARSLLAPGGMLVLWEATRPTRWLDLTFGMTPGWWRATGDVQDYPLMPRERWATMLEAAGFSAPVLASDERASERCGHVVLVAEACGPAPTSTTAERFVLVADAGGVADRLAEVLTRRGHAVVTTRLDPALDGPAGYDHDHLVAALDERATIVWCDGLDATPAAALDDTALAAAAARTCGGLLQLVAACDRAQRFPALWVLTAGATATSDADAVPGLAQAPVWGMARVIRQEHPRLRCRTVDLDPSDPLGAAERFVLAALAEGDAPEPELAERGGRARVPRLVPVEPPAAPPPAIHPDAWYLVTGGLGSIGLAIARWLADQGARHLALLGRTPPSDAAAPQLAALTALGVEVAILQADVSDPARLHAVLAPLLSGSRPLRGVVHAAGVLHERLLVQHDWGSFARALPPKLAGAWNLHVATRSAPLDLFVLCSSGCALLGGVGSSSYAAANWFLGALAHHRRARGLPALCIDWGAWEDFGMARALGRRRHAQWQHVGIGTMEPAQALAALGEVLGGPHPQLGIMPMRWAQVPAQPLLAQIHEELHGPTVAPTTATATPQEPPTVLARLRRITAGVLGLAPEAIDVDQGLTALGLDSLMAVELRNRIDEAWNTRIRFDRLLGGMSLAELAARLEPTEVAAATEAVEVTTAAPALSQAQRGIWLACRLDPDAPTYNVVLVARLREPLQLEALRHAAQAVVDRHAILRTVYPTVEGEPQPQVLPPQPLALELVDGTGWAPERVTAWTKATGDRLFDLEHGPLVRMAVLRTTDAAGTPQHVMSWAIHHLATDFVTQARLVDELDRLYAAALHGRAATLPAATPGYDAFVRWEAEAIASRRQELAAYWERTLAGATLDIPVPTRPGRPPRRSPRTDHHAFRLETELVARVRELARREQVTPFTVLLTAWAVVLARFSGQRDLVVSTPMSTRTARGLEQLPGCCINPVLLRLDLRGEPSRAQLLARVHGRVREALDHGVHPYAEVLRGFEREAALRVGFVLDSSRHRLTTDALVAEVLRMGQQGMDEPLYLSVFELGDDVSALLQYDPTWLEPALVERLAMHLRTALRELVTRPAARRGLPSIHDAASRHAALEGWPAPLAAAPAPALETACIHELVAQQAARTPDAIAVASAGRRLTYAALVERAASLAARLRAQGVGPETLVAIAMERSVDLLVGLLGIFMAGGAYVPLERTLPPARQRYLLEDSGARVLLTDAAPALELPAGVAVLRYDHPAPTVAPLVPPPVDPDHVAYVLYTSGSTGRPKGVAIAHGSVAMLLRWGRHAVGERALAGMLASTPLGFDVSVFELLLPLVCGGTCVVVRDPFELCEGPPPYPLTAMGTVPSIMRELLAQTTLPAGIELVTLAGEALPRDLVDRLHAHGIPRVIDAYGPTESTVFAIAAELPRGELGPPPIGHPVTGTRAYILDEDLEPVPHGATGDLHLAGAGLARGYFRRPGLTAASFVPSPFGPGRLYRTGDRARRRDDGLIEYLGRRDHQTKIRGVRIELGEIEAVLREHPAVHEAVVVIRGADSYAAEPIAFAQTDGTATEAALREHLAARLPAPVVPTAVVLVEQLPRNQSGKLDRAALAALGLTLERTATTAFVAPRTELEARLAALWCEVLGVPRVGVNDRFTDLGGHSLLATRIVSRIHAGFGVDLPLRAFFERPTVAELAEALQARTLLERMQARAPSTGPMETGEL